MYHKTRDIAVDHSNRLLDQAFEQYSKMERMSEQHKVLNALISFISLHRDDRSWSLLELFVFTHKIYVEKVTPYCALSVSGKKKANISYNKKKIELHERSCAYATQFNWNK